MHILLDESVPGRLASLLIGHSVVTVQRRGWASIKNGKLLALAAGEFDVLLTADKGMEYQQNLATLPVSILIATTKSSLRRSASKRWATPATAREVYDTERHLPHAACTRARDHLLVTSVEPASEFLDDLRGRPCMWTLGPPVRNLSLG